MITKETKYEDAILLNKIESLLYLSIYDDEELAGECSYEIIKDILYIRGVEIVEAKRNQGFGTKLLQNLFNKYRYGEIKGVVATFVVNLANREIFEGFIARNGFSMPEYREQILSINIEELKKSAIYNLPDCYEKCKRKITTFKDLKSIEKNHIYRILTEEGMAYDWSKDKDSIIEELSFAYMEGDEVVSTVVFSKIDDSLCLKAAYNRNNGVGIIPILWKQSHLITEEYTNYNDIIINSININAYQLVKRLTAGCEGEEYLVTTVHKFF